MSGDVVRGDVDTVEDGPEYDLDFRKHPEQYVYTPDERGVFRIEPYKSELLPLWGFADERTAREAARAIRERFEAYCEDGDFVGADVCRKYLRMGYTRAMRYATYPGGRKYDDDGTERDPEEWADPEKRAAAEVFERHWEAVRTDDRYRELREAHERQYGDG